MSTYLGDLCNIMQRLFFNLEHNAAHYFLLLNKSYNHAPTQTPLKYYI